MRLIAWLALLVWLTFLLVLGWHTCALAQSGPSVQLAWDPVSYPQLAGYQIQRCEVVPPASTCTPEDLPGATTGATVSTYTDTSVSTGLTYRYTVIALCTSCTPPRSDPSNLVTVTLGAPPSAPPALAVAASLPSVRVTADSEETHDGRLMGAAQAVDGDPLTMWHTPYVGSNLPGYPHTLTFELPPGTWWVAGVRYLPRQSGTGGMIKQFRVRVSDDGVQWTGKGTSPVLAAGARPALVRFAPVLARFVQFVALSPVTAGQWFASAAEVGVIQGQAP